MGLMDKLKNIFNPDMNDNGDDDYVYDSEGSDAAADDASNTQTGAYTADAMNTGNVGAAGANTSNMNAAGANPAGGYAGPASGNAGAAPNAGGAYAQGGGYAGQGGGYAGQSGSQGQQNKGNFGRGQQYSQGGADMNNPYSTPGNNYGMNGELKTKTEIKVVRPEDFREVNQIADHLLNHRTVVLNIEMLNRENARRIIDFLSGVAYSISGNLRKVSNNTFVVTPENVDITSEMKPQTQQPNPDQYNTGV
jgi:FtsZ-interacting cell division protein YlmF